MQTNTDGQNGFELIEDAGAVIEYRLRANDLKVLLVENRVAPVATFLVLYKVGSRNEATGHTGATHLLEHMMFKGTPTFNKDNNTQIAATLQKIGAHFNATTWYDRTNYYETVPSDKLELAIQLEADRMRNSLIADSDRQSEMTVVRNELDRGQNEPMNVLDEAVYATAFREHPYHHPTIGWRDDVENVQTARLKLFYDTFYHPNNATAIVVGDFDKDEALALIEKHFGKYPASPAPLPEVYTGEPQQEGERRVTIKRTGDLALVQIAHRTVAALGHTKVLSNEQLAARARETQSEIKSSDSTESKTANINIESSANEAAANDADTNTDTSADVRNDIYALVVLSLLLTNGVTSRLYQALVETQMVLDVSANCDQFRDPGLFNVYATVQPDVDPREVEAKILSEIERVGADGVSVEETEKAKRQILAQLAFNRDGTYNVAAQMSEAEAVADWHFYQNYPEQIRRVQPEDVQRVAREYFTEDTRTVGIFIPKTENTNEELSRE